MDNINIVPETDNDILALCGDIGWPQDTNYCAFLERHSPRFYRIFITTGNHEYYSQRNQCSMAEIDMYLFALCSQFTNVTYLQETTFTLGEYLFVGCTLWTRVDAMCQPRMNDYVCIYVDERKATWLDILEIHQHHSEWLKNVIDSTDDKKIVVLTHHPPSRLMLVPERRMDNAYASDCDALLKPPVVCWLSGHTHQSAQMEIQDIPSVSNCYGYPHERDCGYVINQYIEI